MNGRSALFPLLSFSPMQTDPYSKQVPSRLPTIVDITDLELPARPRAKDAFVKRAIRRTPDTGRRKETLLSIVIPTRNERENIPELLNRLFGALDSQRYGYEVIFVDDHSTDGTGAYIKSLTQDFPIRFMTKKGKIGKSYSILQGIHEAKGTIVAMIDADLQYPPEAIPDMVAKLETHDVVVANRTRRKTSLLRRLLSSLYRYAFGRFLLSLRVDVQSGLKVFRRDIFDHISIHTSAWAFDSHFLYKAKRLGCSIGGHDIVFTERIHGQSHVRFLFTGLELMWEAFKLRMSYIPKDLLPFLYYPHVSEYRPKGFANREDYLFLPEIFSIKRHIYPETVSLLSVVALGMAGLAVPGAHAVQALRRTRIAEWENHPVHAPGSRRAAR
jgi:glycosyltransferase involved in cell wall biosynthesis